MNHMLMSRQRQMADADDDEASRRDDIQNKDKTGVKDEMR